MDFVLLVTLLLYKQPIQMLNPRLTNCVDCTAISVLLSDIDCKLTKLANNQYNNIVFALNYPVPFEVMSDLLNYKRILTYKNINPDWTCHYTVEKIASKVKLLIFK